MKDLRPYKVYAISDGVVIDHIPPRQALKVVDLLGANENGDSIITIGVNLESSKHPRKDVVKIEKKALTHQELNKIALVAPSATVNIIRDHEVHEKIHVIVPDEIHGVIKCRNKKCVTNFEELDSFFVKVQNDPLKMKCHYCERSVSKENFKF